LIEYRPACWLSNPHVDLNTNTHVEWIPTHMLNEYQPTCWLIINPHVDWLSNPYVDINTSTHVAWISAYVNEYQLTCCLNIQPTCWMNTYPIDDYRYDILQNNCCNIHWSLEIGSNFWNYNNLQSDPNNQGVEICCLFVNNLTSNWVWSDTVNFVRIGPPSFFINDLHES
jgi:hypothetical protein